MPKEWRVEVVANFENEINLVIAAKEIYAYVYKDIDWSISGHEDIFRYKIKTLVPDIYGNLNDTGNLEDAITIASIQEYHKKISFVVLAVKHKYLNSKRKQQKKQLINKKKNKNKKDLFKQIQRNKALKKLRIKRKKRN